ncbi:DNA polymerase/3'-5' exonuclease PolX [Candidatus Palauibacter sp.]|uniref:DNA polymerase/3'-5' exonuclease PolX n=1 Tax=Candidatus Palauibacter sp. TaxID=3101350 RepID=UPI003D0A9956
MENIEIVRVLDEVADLLEIQQANPFRVRAYRNAVRTINAHASPLRKLVEQGADLTELPSIGKGLADNIRELVESGRLTMLEEMAAEIPPGLVELIRLPGVGPRKARKLWDELGVESIDDLEEVANEGRVAELPGFGLKTQDRILRGIRNYRTSTTRFRLGEVDKLLPPLIEHLQGTPGITRLEVAGSYRRRKETVGDIDILVLADDARAASDALSGFSGVESVIGAGGTKTSVRLRSGLQVDLRVVPPESWGAALIYFTGSKEHNIRLRRRALERKLRVSEYGVFTIPEESLGDALGERGIASEGEMVAGATEEEVYRALDLSWLAPEIRRDRGELPASDAGELPHLVESSDLRGDVHMHSDWSDGRVSLETMVEACVARGYEYMAITDHSKALAMVEGLDAAKLRRQWDEIAQVQVAHPEIRILRGLEVDILRDGSLDLEDEMLDQLDVVIISVHSFFGMERARQTSRVLKALAHPRSMIFGHPTGRIINRRGPIDVDIDDILHACAEFGVAVEVNSHPHRLDLKDSHLWRARELGVPVVVATDAHRPDDLDLAHYGIEQARRAWLTPEHVLNTRGVDDFLKALQGRPAI